MENAMILQLKQNLLTSNITLHGQLFNLILEEKNAVQKDFAELRQKIHTMEEDFRNDMNDYERNQLRLKQMKTHISLDKHVDVLKQCQDFTAIFGNMMKHVKSVRENIEKITKVVDSCNESLIIRNKQGKIRSIFKEPLASKSNPFVSTNFNFGINTKEEGKATSQTEDNVSIENYQPSYKQQRQYALEVRKLHEQGDYEGIMFNPKYSYFFRNLTHDDYKSLLWVLKRKLPNFSLKLGRKFAAWEKLFKRMRYKYHSELCLDYHDEPGGFHQQQLYSYGSKMKQYAKITCMIEISNFKPRILNQIFCLFSEYYFKLSGSKLKLYGYIAGKYRGRVDRYNEKIFTLPHILKLKMKFFQFGEDWIIPFYKQRGFTFNMDEDFSEKLWKSHEDLELLRKDFTNEIVKRLIEKYL